jgi:hypothetical protein
MSDVVTTNGRMNKCTRCGALWDRSIEFAPVLPTYSKSTMSGDTGYRFIGPGRLHLSDCPSCGLGRS